MKVKKYLSTLIVAFLLLIAGGNKTTIESIWNEISSQFDIAENANNKRSYSVTESNGYFSDYNIPKFNGTGIIELNDNVPYFTEVSDDIYLSLSELDDLGRCGEAKALVGTNSLATEERGSISHIKPSGWHLIRYDDLISDHYLYNRSHLIMYALYGSETNVKQNLITGTRFFNATEMLSYESQILDYIKETGNNVEYHVIPIFVDDELVARGVIMQALSETGDFYFNIFCYNVQPGIEIDYATGDSWVNDDIVVY